MSPDDFRVPATHPRDRDLVISWAGLSQPADLLIERTLLLTEDSGMHVTAEGGQDQIRQHLGPGGLPLSEGSYTIPAAYLVSPGRSVTNVTIEITSSTSGKFLHPVLKRSTITALRKIVLNVDVVDPAGQ
jgi:hypothetical protein